MAGKPNIKAIDLFAGIGGIRLGFEQAMGKRFRVVFASEINKSAQKVYFDNFPQKLAFAPDVTKCDAQSVPDFDICMAGFPCQAFSIAGKKLGFNDNYKGLSRGTLFHEVVRICDVHNPKVIFCENVRGLPMHDHGRTMNVIINALKETGSGYNVYYCLLKSEDFGVPQTRERIYIVCIRKDIDPIQTGNDFPWPEPTGAHRVLRDIIEDEPVNAKYYLSEGYLNCLIRHRERQEARNNGFGYRIKSWDEPAGTLVCGGMGRERNLIIDTRQKDLTPVTRIHSPINTQGIRRLTPRECARLQGFPDTFKFEESDGPAYTQLGNSVTVPVIEAIATKIKDVLHL